MFACVNGKIKLYKFSSEFEGKTYNFFSQDEADRFKVANDIALDVEALDTTAAEWMEGIEVKNYNEALEIFGKGIKPLTIEEQISNIELALVELYEGGLVNG